MMLVSNNSHVRASSTRQSLQKVALRLFLERGYDTVSVATVAKAAGVSHMTFFRHFPTKESVVVGDLFDPALAAAVAADLAGGCARRRATAALVAAVAGGAVVDGALGAVEPPWRWTASGWARELALKAAMVAAIVRSALR